MNNKQWERIRKVFPIRAVDWEAIKAQWNKWKQGVGK